MFIRLDSVAVGQCGLVQQSQWCRVKLQTCQSVHLVNQISQASLSGRLKSLTTTSTSDTWGWQKIQTNQSGICIYMKQHPFDIEWKKKKIHLFILSDHNGLFFSFFFLGFLTMKICIQLKKNHIHDGGLLGQKKVGCSEQNTLIP